MGNLFCDKKRRQFALSPNDIQNVMKSNVLSKLLSNQFLNLTWEDLKEQYVIDEKYGCSFDLKNVPLDPYYQPWIEFVEEIHEFIKKKEVNINNLPIIKLDILKSDREKLRVYSLLCYVTNAYLFNDYSNIPQVLPLKLAQPFYLLTQSLGIKPAIGWAQCFSNWKLKDEHQPIYELDNLAQRWTFTGSNSEEAFFLLTNITDFRMARALKAGFQANQHIASLLLHNLHQVDLSLIQSNLQYSIYPGYLKNQIKGEQFESVQRFFEAEQQQLELMRPLINTLLSNENQIVQNIIDCLNIMNEEYTELTIALKQLYQKMKADFFYHELRLLMTGYSNKKLFPNGLLFEGIDIRSEEEGGSGGNSPSFQIYERLLGLIVDGQMERLQQGMRRGMIQKHKDLIKFCEKNSLIRLFAQITKNIQVKISYNKAIDASVQFWEKHNYYVSFYIEKPLQQINPNIVGDDIKTINDVSFKFVKTRHIHSQQFLIQIN